MVFKKQAWNFISKLVFLEKGLTRLEDNDSILNEFKKKGESTMMNRMPLNEKFNDLKMNVSVAARVGIDSVCFCTLSNKQQ